jgi:hypothetical protein
MNIGSASIKGMNSYIFNEKLGRYEQISWYLTGKSSLDIATEYKLSEVRIRQYALEKKIPYVGTIEKVKFYVFDEAAEEVFKNRKTTPGREPVEKPPKVPGKPGRPRKEKIVNTSPKRSVGRPRKKPAEALNIVPKRRRGKKRKK